jgi:hypothetical protein
MRTAVVLPANTFNERAHSTATSWLLLQAALLQQAAAGQAVLVNRA